MKSETFVVFTGSGNRTRTLFLTTCQHCQKQYYARRDSFGKYCSKTCSGRARRVAVRPEGKGYLHVHAENHPRANYKGLIRLHRYVAERAIGRPLSKDEDVHHRDGNIYNNEPANLEVVSKSTHRRLHAGWVRDGQDWLKTCNGCQRFLKVNDTNFAKRRAGDRIEIRSRCRKCEKSRPRNRG